ncbi:hypothetical protein BYT27DRAFT_7238918 [Phlegmacium glaucopus]|nr:hypothetical protein BYT27DRAFT_7238918 [Phlegmacium glaucopus]
MPEEGVLSLQDLHHIASDTWLNNASKRKEQPIGTINDRYECICGRIIISRDSSPLVAIDMKEMSVCSNGMWEPSSSAVTAAMSEVRRRGSGNTKTKDRNRPVYEDDSDVHRVSSGSETD